MNVRNRITGLRWVNATELLPNEKNWRRHPESQTVALRDVLERIGYADALIARDAPEGLVLIDGHLRRELALEGPLPVLVLDVTEEEAETLLASLDPLASMAIPDAEALRSLLETAVVPDDLLAHLAPSLETDWTPVGAEDEIPDAPEPRVSPGEIWELGRHRLMCGDATRAEDLGRLLGGTKATLLWTDPPYGVGYVGKTPQALTITNDDPAGVGSLLRAAFGAVDEVLAPGAALYVMHPAGPQSVTFALGFIGAGWLLRQTLVWVKDRMVMGHGDYHYRHEPILYGYKPGRSSGRGRRGWTGGNDQDSVFEVPRPAASRDHPTAKPVELIARCLQNSSAPRARILDPFCGSGSTVIACEQLGRVAYALDVDPAYCDVALTRWERLSGRRAVRGDG